MRRWAQLAALTLAGESIYLLPYLRKTFQTSMEAVFELSSTELGQLNTTLGLTALLSYFPGGWLADRVPTRHLMTLALVATAPGALVMLARPEAGMLFALHAYWGSMTGLLFWSALIKATRDWGDAATQGLAFGLLDGGRGLVAALLASFATYLFAREGSLEDRFDAVLWVYGLAPLAAAFCVWFTMPTRQGRPSREPWSQAEPGGPTTALTRAKACLRMPEAWLLAAVIFAAYWLYLGSFELPAYAERVEERSKSFGAVLGTARDWLRPLAAVGAGLLADRVRCSRLVSGCFVVLALTCASLALAPAEHRSMLALWLQVAAMAACVFALRGVYYALLEESRVPAALTGTTVGFVSVMGYLPDTFAFLVSGALTDEVGVADGYRVYFGVLVGVALLGLAASVTLGLVGLEGPESRRCGR